MPTRVAVTTLNASTIDILNTIRANASYEYQSTIPSISTATEIPKVGEILMGYPALANQFLSSLINRIALVRVKSAVFNNAYAELKKGYLEFGETVEEVFVNITKAREFSTDKAESRELKKSLPDVRTAFHSMNWRVQYPISITDEEFRMAFLSVNGVEDLIAKIVSAVSVAAEYDEYLLFKYLIIKAVSKGKMYPVALGGANYSDAAVAFRGTSNALTFMSTKYNATGVHNVSPKSDQYIFMDAQFNAAYDVNVLASAFNMDKADFMGKLKLIDDFTTFDNDRFDIIRANSDMIDTVTDAELALMADVKAVLVDKEWFQVYDNQTKFTEKYVASGEYWNYFLNVWKTVSSSPFSNAVVFVANGTTIASPGYIPAKVASVDRGSSSTIITIQPTESNTLADMQIEFVQDATNTAAGVAVHKYGAYVVPSGVSTVVPVIKCGGKTYTGTSMTVASVNAGADIGFMEDVTTASITLNESAATVKNTKTLQLVATTVPDGVPVTWTSSATAKATVSDTGLVTGKADSGTATITASFSYGGETISATCTITCAANS